MLKEKRCSKCAKILSIDCFYKDKYKKDGLKSHCKSCASGYYNRWHNRNELHDYKLYKYYKILDELLCIDCGETNNACLEFDHVKDKKVMAVSQMIKKNYSWKAIEKEIQKCEIRCSNCHQKRTALSQGWYKKYGKLKEKYEIAKGRSYF